MAQQGGNQTQRVIVRMLPAYRGAVRQQLEASGRSVVAEHELISAITVSVPLSYLHRFPVNNIKIDRSFISSLTERQEHPAIVESIIALARALGAGVIAEGVETSEQANQLRMMGCGYAQGFYFSKTLPPAAAERFMVRGVGHPTRWVAPD